MGSVSAIWRPASRFEAEDLAAVAKTRLASPAEARRPAPLPDLRIAEHGEDESGVDNDEKNNDHAPHKLKLSAGTEGTQVVGHGDVITQDQEIFEAVNERDHEPAENDEPHDSESLLGRTKIRRRYVEQGQNETQPGENNQKLCRPADSRNDAQNLRAICSTRAAHAGENAHDNFVCKGGKDNRCNEEEEADGPMASEGPQCVQYPLMRHGFYRLN